MTFSTPTPFDSGPADNLEFENLSMECNTKGCNISPSTSFHICGATFWTDYRVCTIVDYLYVLTLLSCSSNVVVLWIWQAGNTGGTETRLSRIRAAGDA